MHKIIIDGRGYDVTQEVLPGIFQIKVPLPKNPLKELNTYLVKGEKRHLLIDTGFDLPECKLALLKGLDDLGITIDEIDFFLTHVHADHTALIYNLAKPDSIVYFSDIDAQIMQDVKRPDYFQRSDASLELHGFFAYEPNRKKLNAFYFAAVPELNFRYVHDGDIIYVGPYQLRCVLTPGHSPGHTCLYEEEHQFMFSGDHVLNSITPNITAWIEIEDSLGRFLDSLDLVSRLEVQVALPGHRDLIRDFPARIDELKQHHQKRLAEIQTILTNGPMTAYQVAELMTWDLKNMTWDQYPVTQKRFATLEVIAHLDYLYKRQKVTKTQKDGYIVFALAQA